MLTSPRSPPGRRPKGDAPGRRRFHIKLSNVWTVPHGQMAVRRPRPDNETQFLGNGAHRESAVALTVSKGSILATDLFRRAPPA